MYTSTKSLDGCVTVDMWYSEEKDKDMVRISFIPNSKSGISFPSRVLYIGEPNGSGIIYDSVGHPLPIQDIDKNGFPTLYDPEINAPIRHEDTIPGSLKRISSILEGILRGRRRKNDRS